RHACLPKQPRTLTPETDSGKRKTVATGSHCPVSTFYFPLFRSILDGTRLIVDNLMMDRTFHSFTPLGFELPEPLQVLERLSKNFYWSWHPEGVELFRDLDPLLWNKAEQNPRRVLSEA